MKPGRQLARYVSKTPFDAFPEDVVDKAKELILDSVGCALGATQTEFSAPYGKLAAHLGAKPESSVPGVAARVSSMVAANVNTQLANLLDFDDTYDVYPPAHPGCQIVQTALAIAEALGSTGKDLLTAVVLGYEVSLRVGLAEGSILWRADAWSLANPIGPAVAAGKLLGLSENALWNAFGILQGERGLAGRPLIRAKLDISGTAAISEASIKGNYGAASLQGVLAAWQAKEGVGGFEGILDVSPSQWYLMGLPVGGYDCLVEGLGERYRILDVSLKPTPSCRWTHVPITAVWDALQGRNVKVEEIDRIVVKGVNRLERYHCDTMLDAQFSIPCAVALTLAGPPPGPAWYTTGRFKASDIRQLANKVVLEPTPAAEAYEIQTGKMMCTVEIALASGDFLSATARHIKGAPDNPLTVDEQLAKFRANASVLGESRISRAVERILGLEAEADARDLMQDVYRADSYPET